MKLLLDTHLLLWAAIEPNQLSKTARILINNKNNTLLFSVASLWEIAIKNTLGREDFYVDPRILRRGLLDNDYHELSINAEHVVIVDTLPTLHKDPFDRILIAQCIIENITFLTADSMVAQYPGPIQKI